MPTNQEIANLVVRLTASTGQLERRLDKATRKVSTSSAKMERRVKKLDNRFSKVGAKFGVALGGAAVIAGFRKITSAVEDSINKLDDIAKTADGIGLTTDALQELRVAADLSGVDSAALDTSLRRVARTASDAKNGLSTAVRAFDAVDVSVTNADGSLKAIDVLISEIADGMAGMTDATQRAATAQELFGRGGTIMVNLLKDGGAAIDNMRTQARELGVVIDEALIRNAVKAKDELTLLNKAIDTQLSSSLARLGPTLVQLKSLWARFVDTLVDGNDVIREMLGLSFEGELARKIERLRALQDVLAERSAGGFPMRTMGAGSTKELQREESELLARIRELEEQRQALESRASSGGGGGGGGVSMPPKFSFGDALGELAAEADALTLRLSLVGLNTKEQAKLNAEVRIRNKLREAGIELSPTERAQLQLFIDDIGVLAELEEAAREEAARTSKAIADQGEVAERAAGKIGQISDTMASAIIQADSFSDALKGVADALLNIALQETSSGLSKGLQGLIAGAVGSVAGGAVAGKAGATVAKSAKGNVFSGGSVIPFAKGGIVDRPTVFPMKNGVGLMGEAGPEAVLPLTRGRGGKLGVQGGGGNVVVQIVNNTPVKTREEQSTGSNGEQIRRFIIDEVGKATSRGEFDKQQQSRFGVSPKRMKR